MIAQSGHLDKVLFGKNMNGEGILDLSNNIKDENHDKWYNIKSTFKQEKDNRKKCSCKVWRGKSNIPHSVTIASHASYTSRAYNTQVWTFRKVIHSELWWHGGPWSHPQLVLPSSCKQNFTVDQLWSSGVLRWALQTRHIVKFFTYTADKLLNCVHV